MKRKIKFICFLSISMFLLSCGNKDAKTTPEEKKDSTEVIATTQPDVAQPAKEEVVDESIKEEVAEEMTLSLKLAKDPCFNNNPDYLVIKGGKPFDDPKKPYKVVQKENKDGNIDIGDFKKKGDGTYTLSIPGCTNFISGEVKIVLVVTDANNTEKSIIYTIPYCP